jgi:EpsI family protein
MKREGLANAALIGFTLLVGIAVWWLQLRPALRVDASLLGALPMQLGGWSGESVPLEHTVERILRADFNLQRVYTHSDQPEPVWLYVGYYGTERGGRPEHTPHQCYPSAGWQIESESELEIAAARNANEWVVAQDGQRQLVLFWYQSFRSGGMRDNLELSLDHLAGRLSDGRADGALVRISTPLSPDREAARARLTGFARSLDPLLTSRWPIEFPSGHP